MVNERTVTRRTQGDDPEDMLRWIGEEIVALKKIAQGKRKHQTNALELPMAKYEPQESWSWMSGGSFSFILMESCPGQQLSPHNFYG